MRVSFLSSLGFKIGVTIVAVEAAALALLGNFYVTRFSAQVDRALEESLAKPGDLMARGTINLNMVSDRKALEKLVGPSLVDAMIVGANGNIFHATEPRLVGMPATNVSGWNPQWLRLAQKEPVVEEARHGNDTFLTRVAAIGADSAREPFLFSCVQMRTTAAEMEKAALRNYFLAGSVATVCVTSAALLLCFNLLVSRRLSRVAEAVARVADGDWAARVPGKPGRDEIGQMHGGVDLMAARLQQTIRSLESTVADLHAAIAARKAAEDERLNLERQVLHAQKLESLGMLAGGIAHDFNNILTAILGHADLVLMDMPADSPFRDNLTEIEKAAMRAADLARQMLAYSGKGKFLISNVRINDLVHEFGQLLAVSVSKKVRLIYELADKLPTIQGDESQVGQVIMNLITNASEAVGDHEGRVVIRTGTMTCDAAFLTDGNKAFQPKTDAPPAPGLYVFIEVEDSGSGMNAATLDRIFDPFFTTKFTGRGLGLAAVMGIVRGHRGVMKVRSAPGAGTTFRVLFPSFAAPGPKPAAADAAAVADETWHGRGLVMFVDDEKQVLTLGREMLRELGFDVLLASDGLEAVELFKRRATEIRLVVLDMTMPHLDGVATLRELRAIRADIPVILCSGFSEQSVAEHFTGVEIAGFIQKPFTFDEFSARIRTAIEHSAAHATT